METRIHISEPTQSCPFRVAVSQHIPASSRDDGLTLVFLHAMSLHKETFEPMLQHLVGSASSIQDIWCIDNPNHGKSSELNQELLSRPEYREFWSASEYSRAAHTVLCSTSHGVDFSRRRIIGLAHSSAVATLMHLQRASPKVAFAGFILLDPALLPPPFPSTTALTNMFGKFAASKRDKWPSRAEARKDLARHPSFKNWDARALDLFVEHALRDSKDGHVTLACSKPQESAFYLSPNEDYKAVPVHIFLELTRKNEIPIHLITCLQDEYKGLTLPSKKFQMERVKSMTKGSVQVLDKGGHMFPQVEPALCAQAIQIALARLNKEMAHL
ncbi:alpha/beta-hydrolase [Mycena rebaudengoi]|nr:alpha/beta-hydrolase [Mycena rebaudengoi]